MEVKKTRGRPEGISRQATRTKGKERRNIRDQ
jgi:hypothetical protein